MTKEDFFQILKRHCQSGSIDRESKLVDDLGLCSFDMMMIITEAEKEYGVRFSFQTTEKIKTAADFYYHFK
ncbi:MAG: acyl carrier protein [Clostridia bacterium]|nr:acyl carrier protein [Clostridia bacterium]